MRGIDSLRFIQGRESFHACGIRTGISCVIPSHDQTFRLLRPDLLSMMFALESVSDATFFLNCGHPMQWTGELQTALADNGYPHKNTHDRAHSGAVEQQLKFD